MKAKETHPNIGFVDDLTEDDLLKIFHDVFLEGFWLVTGGIG